jgi:predicted TPR repeat methyltransferase
LPPLPRPSGDANEEVIELFDLSDAEPVTSQVRMEELSKLASHGSARTAAPPPQLPQFKLPQRAEGDASSDEAVLSDSLEDLEQSEGGGHRRDTEAMSVADIFGHRKLVTEERRATEKMEAVGAQSEKGALEPLESGIVASVLDELSDLPSLSAVDFEVSSLSDPLASASLAVADLDPARPTVDLAAVLQAPVRPQSAVSSAPLPALWGLRNATRVARRASANQSRLGVEPTLTSGMLRMRTGVEGEFEKLYLPGLAVRMSSELLAEVSQVEPALQSAYLHLVATACRQSVVSEASTLARQLDTEAVELDPNLLLAHLWLVLGAWRESDWEDCALALGRMATQLDEIAHVRKELTTQLPLLYTLLELMMEWRLSESSETLLALCQHALSIEGNRLVALLNFTRQALARRDELDTGRGYRAVISSAPPIVAEAFAIDWMNQLWLERADPRAALGFWEELGELEVRDPYHLACVQMLAWANLSASLEIVALRGWSAFDEMAAYQPRSSDEGALLASRRAAFRHRISLLAAQQGEQRVREMELHEAIGLDPLCPLYVYEWAAESLAAGKLNAYESACSAQLALAQAQSRRHAIAFAALSRGVDLDALSEEQRVELGSIDEPAAKMLYARHLRKLGESEAAARVESALCAETLPWMAGVLAELELGDFELASSIYREGLANGASDPILRASLRRCARALGLELEEPGFGGQGRDSKWRMALQAQGLDEQVEKLGELVREDASELLAWQYLIERLVEQGDYRRLDASCQKLSSLAGGDDFLSRWALEYRVLVLSAQPPAAGIARALKDLATAYPDSVMLWQGEYQQLVRVGKWQDLVQHCEIEARRHQQLRSWLQLRSAWIERTLLGNAQRALELIADLCVEEEAAPVVRQAFWMLLAETGDWERLSNAFERMLQSCGPSPRSALLQHLGSLRQDRLSEIDAAERAYRSALALDPDAAGAWRELIGAAWRRRDWEALSRTLKERLERELSPMVRRTHLRERGFVTAVLLNQLQLAEQSYLQLLELDRDVFALRGLSRLARVLGNNPALIRLLGEMVEEIDDPFDQLYALAEQGRCLQRVNGVVSAEWMSSLAELMPGHPLFEFFFFTMLEEKAIAPQQLLALSELLIGSEHRARSALDRLMLARLLRAADEHEQAQARLRGLWEEDPDCIPALLELLANAQRAGQHEEALACFAELRGLFVPLPMPRAALLAARAHAQACGKAEVLSAIEAELGLLEDQGEVELELSDPSQFLALCEELLGVQNSPLRRGYLLVNMARLQESIQLERSEASYALWLAAARLVPASREVHQALMRYAIYDELGTEQRAELRRYLLGLLQSDEYVEMWLQIANVHENRDDADGAREALDTVLSCNPGERRALQRLAELAWERGEIDIATSWLQKLAHITTHRGLRAAIELEIGLILETLFERPLESFDHYSRALEALPSDASLLYFGARAMESLEEWGTAAQMRLQEASAHRFGSEYQAIIWSAARIFGRRLNSYDVLRGLVDRNQHPSIAFDPKLLLVVHELASLFGDNDTLLLQRLLESVEGSSLRAALCWQGSEWSTDANEQVAWLQRSLECDPCFILAAYPLEFGAAELVSTEALAHALAAQGRCERNAMLLSRAAELANNAGAASFALELLEVAVELLDDHALLLPWGPGSVLMRVVEPCVQGRVAALREALRARHLSDSSRMFMEYQFACAGSGEEALRSWRWIVERRSRDGYAKERLELLLGKDSDRRALLAQRRHRLDSLRARVAADTLDKSAKVEGNQQSRQQESQTNSEQIRLASWELALMLCTERDALAELRELLDEQLQRSPRDLAFWMLRSMIERRWSLDELLDAVLSAAISAMGEDAPAQWWLEKGLLAHFSLDRKQDAIAAYQMLLAAQPSCLIAHDALGELLPPDSAEWLSALESRIAAEVDESYRAVLLFQLGVRLEGVDAERAYRCYEQALESAPDLQAAQIALERLLFMAGRSEQCLDLYARIGEHAPAPIAAQYLAQYAVLCDEERRSDLLAQLSPEGQHPAMLLQRFRIASTTQSPEAVAEVCHAFAHWVKESSAARLLLESAVAFASATDWAVSEDLLWHLHEAEPSNRGLLLQLGATIDFAGERAEVMRGLEALARAAGSSREKALVALDQAIYLLSVSELGQAAGVLEEAGNHWPRFLPVLKLRRYLAEAEGDPERIAVLAEEEAGLARESSNVLRCLMQAASMRQVRLQDMQGAKRLFMRILEIDPLHEGAFISLDSLLAGEQAFDAQRALLRRRAELVTDEETRKRLLARAAQIAASSDNVEAAIDDYEQQLAVDPNDTGTYEKLAQLCIRNERWEQAVHALERLVQRARDHALLHNSYRQLGMLLSEKLSSDSRALSVLRNALKLVPDDLQSLHQLAVIYERSGAHDECLDTLQRIVELEIDFNKKKGALTRLCLGLLQWRRDHAAAEQRLLEMRQLDAQDLSLLEQVAGVLAEQGLGPYREGLLHGAFSTLREQYQYDTSRTDLMHPLHRLCHMLEWQDRAFVFSALLYGEGMANDEETQFYEQSVSSRSASRVVKPPPQLLAMVAAPGLSRGLLELMCLTERAMSRVSPQNVHMKALAWRYKMRPSSRTELSILASFMESFGIGEIPFYVLPERADTPFFMVGRETAFAFTEEDLRHEQLAQTRFRVAAACASVSLGVAAFSALTFSEFHAMILALAKSCAPELQTSAEITAYGDAFAKVLPKKTREQFRPWMLQAIESLTESHLVGEYQALQLTLFRQATLALIDPSGVVPALMRAEVDGTLPVRGATRDMQVFLTGDQYAEWRKESGASIT